MLIGIDVGGTTTDAVLIDGKEVVKTAYVPTTHDDLPGCLLSALDEIVEGTKTDRIERVVLSTTLITNMIAEGKADPVGLILIPGPGTNPGDYRLGHDAQVLSGAIDFRGREIAKLKDDQVKEAVARLASKGYRKIAVVSKFGQRNHAHEDRVKEIISRIRPEAEVQLGYTASGQLNFPRRAATAVLTIATRDRYREFTEQMKKALAKRGIRAPVYILKADGGTLPLDASINSPVETIFSGPAASIMGVLALTPGDQTSVVVDIGGTTTDLALILSGKPLLSSKGARVDSMLTQIRAFAVKSVALGGDSSVRVDGGHIIVGPRREGPAVCMGGACPTPTDAMRVLGMTDIGDASAARRAMEGIGKDLGLTATEASEKVVGLVVDKMESEIRQMFAEWEEEPAYRIWEIVKKEKLSAQNVVGVGGGAPPLVPLVAERLGAKAVVPEYAPVANAIGAAVARPTLTLNLRIDTERGEYLVAEEGITEKAPGKNMNLQNAEDMARKLIRERAEKLGIGEYSDEAEVTYSEVFNMVRGWSTVGRLMNVRMEIPAGILKGWRC